MATLEPQGVLRIANGSMKALNDERVMIPSMYSESISDLKTLLRNLISGHLVIAQGEPRQETLDETDD